MFIKIFNNNNDIKIENKINNDKRKLLFNKKRFKINVFF